MFDSCRGRQSTTSARTSPFAASGGSRTGRRHHGKRRAPARFDDDGSSHFDDFVFTDDVVDEILQVDARGCAVTSKERLPQSALEALDGLGLVQVGRHGVHGLQLGQRTHDFVALGL